MIHFFKMKAIDIEIAYLLTEIAARQQCIKELKDLRQQIWDGIKK